MWLCWVDHKFEVHEQCIGLHVVQSIDINIKFTFRICATVVVLYTFHSSLLHSIFTLFKFRFAKKRIFPEHLTFRFASISQDDLHNTAEYDHFYMFF